MKNNNKIVELNLSNNNFDEVSIPNQNLEYLKNLKVLDMSYNNINKVISIQKVKINGIEIEDDFPQIISNDNRVDTNSIVKTENNQQSSQNQTIDKSDKATLKTNATRLSQSLPYNDNL